MSDISNLFTNNNNNNNTYKHTTLFENIKNKKHERIYNFTTFNITQQKQKQYLKQNPFRIHKQYKSNAKKILNKSIMQIEINQFKYLQYWQILIKIISILSILLIICWLQFISIRICWHLSLLSIVYLLPKQVIIQNYLLNLWLKSCIVLAFWASLLDLLSQIYPHNNKLQLLFFSLLGTLNFILIWFYQFTMKPRSLQLTYLLQLPFMLFKYIQALTFGLYYLKIILLFFNILILCTISLICYYFQSTYILSYLLSISYLLTTYIIILILLFYLCCLTFIDDLTFKGIQTTNTINIYISLLRLNVNNENFKLIHKCLKIIRKSITTDELLLQTTINTSLVYHNYWDIFQQYTDLYFRYCTTQLNCLENQINKTKLLINNHKNILQDLFIYFYQLKSIVKLEFKCTYGLVIRDDLLLIYSIFAKISQYSKSDHSVVQIKPQIINSILRIATKSYNLCKNTIISTNCSKKYNEIYEQSRKILIILSENEEEIINRMKQQIHNE